MTTNPLSLALQMTGADDLMAETEAGGEDEGSFESESRPRPPFGSRGHMQGATQRLNGLWTAPRFLKHIARVHAVAARSRHLSVNQPISNSPICLTLGRGPSQCRLVLCSVRFESCGTLPDPNLT